MKTNTVINRTYTSTRTGINNNVSNTANRNVNTFLQKLSNAKNKLVYIGGGIFVYNKDASYIQIIDAPRSLKYIHKNLTPDHPGIGIPQRYPSVTDFVSVSLNIGANSTWKTNWPTKFSIFSGSRDTFVGSIDVSSNANLLKLRMEVTANAIEFIVFPLYLEKTITVTTEHVHNELMMTTTQNDLDACYPSREDTFLTFSSVNTGAATIYPNTIDDVDSILINKDPNDIFNLFLSVDERILL